MSLDVAFPRNEKDWFEKLSSDINEVFEMKLYYGHLFCHVLHQNYILKKGVNIFPSNPFSKITLLPSNPG